MQVTIIGSGNVATVMGRILVKNGDTIAEVYSHDAVHATELSQLLHAKPVADIAMLDGNSNLYLLAVTDDALAEVAAQLSLKDKLVVHTAGSISKEILKNVSSNYGVLWPMKMIRKSMTTLEPVTMVVDGNTELVTKQLEQLASIFSKTVTRADDDTRSKMHMLAALTSNFTNHLYHLAADFCEAEHIDLSVFYPLIEETAQQIQTHHPKEVQAGPAFRGDRQTLEKHVQILDKYPQIRKVYEAMTASIRVSFSNEEHGTED
ncbi:MAG: hypothetical protein JWQ30_2721 [Sediminibacterium sp.]|nr:hypothetical protein [Sediminibacterium sp.]